jgi:uncharacterized membrane protein YfcA
VVGVISALAGIGGGVVMVPFLYLVYSGAAATLTAQTVVAHATSLGVACVASLIGIRKYARSDAIAWRIAWIYGIPGAVSSFVTARIVSQADEAEWVRGAFGVFLLLSSLDMARRAATHRDFSEPKEAHSFSPGILVVIGLLGGAMTSMLGIGGGLIAVPALIYVARLPIRTVAPTSLVSVGLATLSGLLSYATAPNPPAISGFMAGWVDLRMAIPLAAGAVCTVPLGVHLNRASKPATLYWVFSLILFTLGIRLVWQGWFS